MIFTNYHYVFLKATYEYFISLSFIKNIFCLTVTKGKEVQISMVKRFRVGLEENYEIAEKWFLEDLEMIDGKEADAVSLAFYYKAKLFFICAAGLMLIGIRKHLNLCRGGAVSGILRLT